MDNRIFNVNGRLDRDGELLLRDTLALAFAIAKKKAIAWRKSQKHGLILDWSDCASGASRFPALADADTVLPFALQWLKSDEAKEVELDSWDRDAGHDGHNGPGWRVYCNDWGHVEGWQAIVAVKPTFMWYGK